MASADEQRAVLSVLNSCPVAPCIVELGAYCGEDTEWMFQAVRDKSPIIVTVEADPDNYRRIADRHIPGRHLYGAISDRNGNCDFWACYTPEGRGSGSVRMPTRHLEKNPWYDFRPIPGGIPCFTLDYLFNAYALPRIDLLWVDIQGAENQMITGGQKALRHARYLFIEAEEKALYDGQAERPELLSLLPEWSVIREFDFNLFMKNDAYDQRTSANA